MILKVQQSVFTTENRPTVLFYDAERTVLVQMELTGHLKKLLGSDPKQFWECGINPKGEIVLQHRVPWQKW